MKIDFKKLYRAYKVSRNPERVGDFVLLKADAFNANIEPEIAAKMTEVQGFYPEIDLEKLSQLPSGTFGYEYARYMRENKLTPLKVSSEMKELAERNVFALRYAVTHDIFHILLGFDTSYSGEIGVLAFAASQNYSPALKFSLFPALLIYSVVAPRQIKAIFSNLRQGKQMGQKAKFLLNYRFEDLWHQPLNKLRTELKLN